MSQSADGEHALDKNLQKAAEKWDEYGQYQSGGNQGISWWEAGSAIHEHINYKISGSPEIDWLEHTLNTHLQGQIPLDRCLVLGCGLGHLERRLANKGVFKQCEAYDVAAQSVETAGRLAAEQGYDNIQYAVADVNKIMLPANAYDAVWISAAMHHFEALEHICQQILQALKPGGLLILYEYIGPNRFQFPARQKEVANLCLQLLPKKYRAFSTQPSALLAERPARKSGLRWFASRVIDKMRDGTLLSTSQRYLQLRLTAGNSLTSGKTVVEFPSARDVIADDPSEAVRSADIMRVLQEYFEIVERRDWGGNIVQFLLHGIAGNFSDDDEQSQDLLRMILDIEDIMIRCGEFSSDFSYIVARSQRR